MNDLVRRFASIAKSALYNTTPLHYHGHEHALDNAGRAARELDRQKESAAHLGQGQRLLIERVAASYRKRDAAALVVLDAAQELERVDGPATAAAIVCSAVRRLGGVVVPARAAPRDALPVNLAFDDAPRLLALAPDGSLARIHLEHLLPGLVSMAGRAIERARRRPPHPLPDEESGNGDGRPEPVGVSAPHLLDTLEHAVIATDPDGVVTYCNGAAQRLYGWSTADAVGRPIFEILPNASRAQGEEIFEAVRVGRRCAGDYPVQRKDGSSFLAAVTLTPVHDDSGRRVGMLGLSADVTDARLLDAQVRDRQEGLRLALEAGQLGTWRWDLVTGLLSWDERIGNILGIGPGNVVGTIDAVRDFVHPNDRDAVLPAVDEANRMRSRYTFRHRIIRPDGEIRWIEGRAGVLGDGERVSAVGYVRDITTEAHLDLRASVTVDEATAADRAAEAAEPADFEARPEATWPRGANDRLAR